MKPRHAEADFPAQQKPEPTPTETTLANAVAATKETPRIPGEGEPINGQIVPPQGGTAVVKPKRTGRHLVGDPELHAINEIVLLLKPLPARVRARILAYVADYYAEPPQPADDECPI